MPKCLHSASSALGSLLLTCHAAEDRSKKSSRCVAGPRRHCSRYVGIRIEPVSVRAANSNAIASRKPGEFLSNAFCYGVVSMCVPSTTGESAGLASLALTCRAMRFVASEFRNVLGMVLQKMLFVLPRL